MPPPGYQPFLDHILDCPDEDGPRLVYADWLEEQGEARRAEFIRIQIALASLDEEDPKRESLLDRESWLLQRFGDDWRLEIPPWARTGCEFSRGFVDSVTIWQLWQSGYGEQLSATCPVTRLTIQDMSAIIADSRIRRPSSKRSSEAVDPTPAFFPDPGVRNLREVTVLDSHMSFNSLMNLVNHRAVVEPLKALRFMGTMFGDTGVNILALAEGLANLEKLELHRCAIEARGVLRFTQEPNSLKNLRYLDLSDNNLESDSVWTLTHYEFVKQLTHLILNKNEITSEGVQAIVESPFLSNLTHLELDDNHIGDAAAMQIAETFPNLGKLSLARNLMTASGMLRLRSRFGNRVRLGPVA